MKGFDSAICAAANQMQARLVELTIPDQPKSKLQQYPLTARGRAVFARIPAR
ncbi:MAG: hypothetical protein NTY77_13255 [Elusimicrobia bacterium]|nr:hypothetical protein [Elusimicrobiota bacterium]